MMTLEQIREEMKRYTVSKVARLAGVDRHVLSRLMMEGSNPSYETVKKLSDFLSGGDDDESK